MNILATILVAASIFGNSHDITTLPQWGPYSKQYAGISHVPDVEAGIRVDFSLVPGFYRRSTVEVPSVLYESGCYPWEVSPDLKHITFRQEIEWKDFVYIDATWHVVDDGKVLLEMHCVNNTRIPQSIFLQTASSIHFAEEYPLLSAEGADAYVRATDYDSWEPAVRKHDYRLVYDGKMRGEKRERWALGSSVLQTSGEAGDELKLTLPAHDTPVRMRCRAPKDSRIPLEICGKPFTLVGNGGYCLVEIPCEGTELSIKTLGKGSFQIDGFIIGKKPKVVSRPLVYKPLTEKGEGYYAVKYDALDEWYAVAWNFPISNVNTYETEDLDLVLHKTANNHVNHDFKGSGDGFFTTAFQRPVALKPHSDTTIWNLVCRGSREKVLADAAAFRKNEKEMTAKAGSYKFHDDRLLEAAEPYIQGERLMQATMMTNIVYPVYTQKQYIRHFTPGKNWNSLYTWDSGMISLALNDIDPTLAFENIRAYTTEPGCQSAFIHHGTPLPIQFFAYEDMCGKTCDPEKMAFLYPRLKQYYDYMVGKDGTSMTMMSSGLIRTWDYFYNTGGWDDYPPQWYLRENPKLYPSVAPVVSTAYYIRAAKILRLAARQLGLKADVKQYDKDIAALSKAILDNAWDEETGYFGYVTHDAEGKPDGLLRYRDGSNYNKGLDGISPLVAGIGSQAQKERMLENLFSEEHLWTPYGISTVDKSAPYYRIDGYWNGCIWMPHQLLQWKAMLDLGLAEKADRIAFTALKTWNAETSKSYQCFEHFLVQTGRGSGWHNFSGLSSPMVNWFTAYFRKGTLSTGFDTLVTSQDWNADFSSLDATLSFDRDAAGRNTVLVVCMAPSDSYKVTLGGKPAYYESPYKGLLYITVPASVKDAELHVETEQNRI